MSEDTLSLPNPVAGWLEDCINDYGLKQVEVAKATGIRPQRLHEYLKKDRSLTTADGIKLARFFGVSDNLLLSMQAEYHSRLYINRHQAELEAIIPLTVTS